MSSSSAENSMNLTALSSEVSSALPNLFYQSYYQMYREHVQKKFEWIVFGDQASVNMQEVALMQVGRVPGRGKINFCI